MNISGVTKDSSQDNKESMQPSIISHEEVGSNQTLAKKMSSTSQRKGPPVMPKRNSKSILKQELSRKTSDARDKLLSAQANRGLVSVAEDGLLPESQNVKIKPVPDRQSTDGLSSEASEAPASPNNMRLLFAIAQDDSLVKARAKKPEKPKLLPVPEQQQGPSSQPMPSTQTALSNMTKTPDKSLKDKEAEKSKQQTGQVKLQGPSPQTMPSAQTALSNTAKTPDKPTKDKEGEKPKQPPQQHDIPSSSVSISSQHKRSASQLTQRSLQPRSPHQIAPPKESHKEKRKLCACCCGGGEPGQFKDNDARHIASISVPQKTSRCSSVFCCCCRNNCVLAKCCKKFLTFLFSHIGLCSIVVAYSIMGGFLFQYLEGGKELTERILVARKRSYTVLQLWNMTQELNILYEKNWTVDAERILRVFQDQIVEAVRDKGWDGRDEFDPDVKWSFSGSLLYSITVITTIGYGHIAPKTSLGRLMTMLYALLGIPLTLLCLSNMGSTFAQCFRFFYKYLCNFLAYLCCPSSYKKKRPRNSTVSRLAAMRNKARKTDTDISLVEEGDSSYGYDESGKDGDLKEQIRVPMSVSLLIITSYVFGGAVLFSLWEEDWDYLIGAYFCFVTLSTIGFGDYVFGAGKDLDDNEKLITCALYLVLGLSIIAMCFDLMQEEVRAKFKWLGVKLGIIEDRRPRLSTRECESARLS